MPQLITPMLWPAYANCWTQLPPTAQQALTRRLQWLQQARPAQLVPTAADWHTWLILAGRGFGKTRAGAEETAWQAMAAPGQRLAVVAPTASDARDVCVEGESGLLAILPSSLVETWNRSMGELRLTNGSLIRLYSADAPERLRGPQHHFAWADELAVWRSGEALDQLRFGLRLGPSPRLVITTTPQPVQSLLELVKRQEQGLVIRRGSTFDNAAHLPASVLAELERRYAGTRLGRQELYAELLETVEGALWPPGLVEETRVTSTPELARIVIAVDPATTSGPNADHTGIVAAGLGVDGHAYILRDASCRLSPDGWARRVANLYDELQADLVIGEVNQGGDMVGTVLHTVAPLLPFKAVTAQRGKVLRAEPVVALYEQRMVHHVNTLPELEAEMGRFTALGLTDGRSPDRVDALVWALTALMLQPSSPPRVRPL